MLYDGGGRDRSARIAPLNSPAGQAALEYWSDQLHDTRIAGIQDPFVHTWGNRDEQNCHFRWLGWSRCVAGPGLRFPVGASRRSFGLDRPEER